MNTALAATLDRNRKFLPLAATIGLFVLVYFWGFLSYPAMRDGQAFFNLFDAAPFLIVTVVGESFVIISGGIDLSVGALIAVANVLAASLRRLSDKVEGSPGGLLLGRRPVPPGDVPVTVTGANTRVDTHDATSGAASGTTATS